MNFLRIIGAITAARLVLTSSNVKSFPPKTALILAAIALVLMLLGIGINYFGGGTIRYSHVVFALGLLAFIVWFSGRRDSGE